MKVREPKEHFTVKYCEECKIAFEAYTYGGKHHVIFYSDFPKFKLEMAMCPLHDEVVRDKYIEEYA